MSERVYRSLQALLMLLLFIFLAEKVVSGRLSWYINLRFMPLTILGILILGAMAQIIFTDLRRTREKKASVKKARRQEHHQHEHDHDHDHDHDHNPAWGNLLFLAIPLFVGVLIPARPLDASAVATRGLTTSAPLVSSDSAAKVFETASEERNVLDWLRLFGSQSDLASFLGESASVTGFVFRDEKLTANQFYLGRFVVSCCSADGSAIALVVEWPEAASMQENAWALVKGPMGALTLDGTRTPLLQAETVEFIQEPAQPYLYP